MVAAEVVLTDVPVAVQDLVKGAVRDRATSLARAVAAVAQNMVGNITFRASF